MYIYVCGGSKGAWIEIFYRICICIYAGVLRASLGLGLKYLIIYAFVFIHACVLGGSR